MLLPAESAKLIADNSKYVTIKSEGILKLSEEIFQNLKSGNINDFVYGDDDLHPTSKDETAVDWIFVIDTLNFCFWSLKNTKKWTVKGYTGYYALTAAVRRAIQEGYDITNPKFYASITEDQLKQILRSDDDDNQVPLLSTRVKCLHEVGKVLLEKYDGTFKKCIESANKSAISLLNIIVQDFPCFRDEAMFDNQKVVFYKRAQILISDLWSCYDGKSWGDFHDIEKLTMFADYRVPQALVHFGVMEYSRELSEKLEREILQNGCREEMEIRGCSIHAIEIVNESVKKLISNDVNCGLKDDSINSALIDYFLWLYRRKYADELQNIPFHKVYCQYY
ncbi:queuosine 5'-phosphate N-glycosylase/hydrolase isoform X2 [Arctopsyche grandis]|uniref:queuosine 5'-phosphate N-glycosylase/hydrolase isoform X2 n=1 Tax=Arctopsyche grandis TaxID=121162 RepID=UPI00406D9C88